MQTKQTGYNMTKPKLVSDFIASTSEASSLAIFEDICNELTNRTHCYPIKQSLLCKLRPFSRSS